MNGHHGIVMDAPPVMRVGPDTRPTRKLLWVAVDRTIVN